MRARKLCVAIVVLVSLTGCTIVDGFAPTAARGPGSLYESYLAGSSERILVEIDHSPGALWDPSTPAEEQFVQQLEHITGKDVEIRYSEDLPAKGHDYAYSLTELRELHREQLDATSQSGTEIVHALFLDGKMSENVAGVAFEPRAFALFKGQIRDKTCLNGDPVCHAPCPQDETVCAEWVQPSVEEWRVTRSVAIHEAGHLFGLVNNPLPMVEDHEMVEDPNPDTPHNEGQAHSDNPDSVMYWAVENVPEVDDFLDGGDVPWRFDENDIQDARTLQR